MNHSPESKESLQTLVAEFRRMRLIFGVTLIALSLILTVVLPSVIRSAVFRVSNDPESKGLLTHIIEIIRGEPITSFEDPAADPTEEDAQMDNPESSA